MREGRAALLRRKKNNTLSKSSCYSHIVPSYSMRNQQRRPTIPVHGQHTTAPLLSVQFAWSPLIAKPVLVRSGQIAIILYTVCMYSVEYIRIVAYTMHLQYIHVEYPYGTMKTNHLCRLPSYCALVCRFHDVGLRGQREVSRCAALLFSRPCNPVPPTW